MVGLVRGSMSKVITSYPSSRSRLATDPVPENKSKALPFLETLRLAVCPTGLSAIFKELTKSGEVTGLKVTGGEKEKDEVDEVRGIAVVYGADVGGAEGMVAGGLRQEGRAQGPVGACFAPLPRVLPLPPCV